MPERLLGNRRILVSEWSRKGARDLAADDGRISNLGEARLGFLAKEQHQCRITFQVAEVKRPLLTARTLMQAGNDVRFTSSGGKIAKRQTQRTINFSKVGG
eukprot:11439968-Alexandrium_andersonii.AAC.1